jgi:DNA-binding transcriptional ArsR family regulator
MDEFIPQPMQIVETTEQIKAFTDPLRVRVLRMLSSRAATNQQAADALGEPQAKVLYHIRFLLDVGLIRLVDTQIKGGNVEKYYRAVAQIFDLRPPPDTDEQTNLALSDSLIENMRFEFLSSVVRFPKLESYIHTWSGWLSAERMAEFNRRLLELFKEFWPEEQPADQPAAFKARLGVMIYRDPREPPTAELGD